MPQVEFWPSEGTNDIGTSQFTVQFKPNTASDPLTSTYRGGWISTCTYVAAGHFQVTLVCSDMVTQVLDARAEVQALSNGATPMWGNVYWDETAATLTFDVFTGAENSTSLSAPADTRIITLSGRLKFRFAGYSYT